MYTITVSEKGGQQSTFEFNKSEVTIGRMKGNDIVLPKGNVSKRHSRIFAQDGGFKIIDLESTNGTYVNGRKITGEQQITENDKIYIGDFILQVESEAKAAAGPPIPPPGNPSPPLPGPGPGPGSGPMDPLRGSGAQRPVDPGPLGSGSGMSLNEADPMDFGGPDLNFDDLAEPAPTPEPPRPGPAPNGGSAGPRLPSPGGGPSRPSTPVPSAQPVQPAPPKPQPTPKPAPQPSPQPVMGGARPEEVRVDRHSDRAVGRPEYSQVSAILQTNDLESEFDQQFHAAQHDVATVLFETVTAQDLPFQYPPAPEDLDRFQAAVEKAVKTVNPRVAKDELTNLIAQECVGLGPIDMYLDDPEVQDIYVNRWDNVLIRRGGRLVQAARAFSHPQLLMAAAYRLLGPREMETLTDEMRFGDGTRVHVILPPLSPDGPAITVRKPPTHHPTLDELVGDSALSSGMAEFLSRCIEAGRSILIAGPTGSGKSTLLSALTQQMPSGVRLVAVQNGSYLALPQNSVRLEPNPALGFETRYLLSSALAMHPQRIVLDECRGAEAYDWVTSATCGTEGSLATLHGTSAAEALGRLESLCLMGSSSLSPRGLREQIARAVNVVVVVNRTHEGRFRVHQITEVQGVDLDAFRLNDVFYYRVEGADGGFHPTGYVPLFYEDMRHAGADVDFGIFRE